MREEKKKQQQKILHLNLKIVETAMECNDYKELLIGKQRRMNTRKKQTNKLIHNVQ